MEIRNVEITNFHQKNACQKVLKIPMVRMMCFTTSLRVRLNLCNTRSLEAIGIRSQDYKVYFSSVSKILGGPLSMFMLNKLLKSTFHWTKNKEHH